MSAVTLARRLSLRRADGTLATLPRLTEADHPLSIRAHLLAFYEIRDGLERMRSELVGHPDSLQDRLILAGMLDDVGHSIEAAKRALRCIARKGGQGFAPALELTAAGEVLA